jgi:prepilin-type N-terminal cleavage/methylation domain-containing protein
MSPSIRNPRSAIRNRRRRGFTLIECALVTVIVGVGVLAIVSAEQGFHQENDFSQRAGTAMLLANEIRELTLGLPRNDPITGNATWGPEANELSPLDYDDLDDFAGPGGHGATISPPMNAQRQTIPNMTGWTQRTMVENVLEGYLNGPAAPNNSTNVMRITCTVLYQGTKDPTPQVVTSLVWFRAGD